MMQRFSLTAKNSSGHQELYIDLDHEDLDDGVAITLVGEYEGERIQIDFDDIDRVLFKAYLQALLEKMGPLSSEAWPERFDREELRRILQIPPEVHREMVMGDPSRIHEMDPPDKLTVQERSKTMKAIRAMLELMRANFADPGFSVYNRNNELIASVSEDQQQRVEELLRYLLEEGLTILQRNNLEDVAGYQELIGAVQTKYPGESRHETALRYIREAEARKPGGANRE